MFLDGYSLLELIARSERNSLRRARRRSDGAAVVIKTATTDYPTARDVRRLEFEYRVLKKLRGPFVIEALDLERQAGRAALVLEDFGGEPLPVVAGKGLALDRFFPLATAIVRALGEVHAQGVVHKDINPRNVLLNPTSGVVKVIDFSLATELARETARALDGKLAGTLPYIAPEQTGRMNRDLDYRADYYSLGITFFELLTGSLPFRADDMLGYVHCHLGKQAPSARERNGLVPEALAALVQKLMAKNPDDRYQSAAGLLRDLERCREAVEAGGQAPAFTLGEHDVSSLFEVSQALVGREQEVSALLAAFERASTGPVELFVVAGYSGVGKSSLVRELYKPVLEKRGHFVSGKFEELERNLPYGALLQALRALLKQMLTESEERLLALRARLEAALGTEANALVTLLPELGRIMGPQPPIAELGAREAQARLERAFRSLFSAVASAEEPLVVFLDDLQWADASTPELIAGLCTDESVRHVLVLAAYRDNEVSESHLVSVALRTLERKRPSALHELRLAPLTREAVVEVVARTLHARNEPARLLADRLFQKAAGNPFFTTELLQRLHREGAIRFDAGAGAWTLDTTALDGLAFGDNVVDLMVERLRELPPESLSLMPLAACLGTEFDLELLARVAGKPRRAVALSLWHALEARLLVPRAGEYRFLPSDEESSTELDRAVRYAFPHDRVTQAAYSLLDPGERARLHLSIGRLLCDEIPVEARATRVFEFVDHMNLGRALVTSLAARRELANHNFLAAERARRAAAYVTAVTYLELSATLLTADEWAGDPARRFELERMRIECLFLAGEVERASGLVAELFAQAPGRVARASAYRLKAQLEEQQSQLGESVATILAGAKELGLELPTDPVLVEQGIGEGIGKLLAHLERVPIEDLAALPVLEDPERIALTELLFQLIPPASQMNPPLFILAELLLFDLALTHGTVPGSAKNFMDSGIVLGAILKDYPRAYRMGKVAFTLLERQIPTPLESAVNFVFGCFISHWGAHYQEGLDALARGHRRGVELGDTLHASYSVVHHAKSSLFAGVALAECRAAMDHAFAYTRATGAVGHEAVPRMLRRALGRLQAADQDVPDVALSADEFTREIEKTGNDHFLFVLGQLETLVHVVLGAWDDAERANRAVEARLGVGNGSFPVPDYYLFGALILCRKSRLLPDAERAHVLARVAEHVAALQGFATVCPANFAHKHKLALAELKRSERAPIDEVLPLYSAAVAAAGEDFTHLRALAYELQADFWSERLQPQLARECLLESYHLYRHWGAREKLARLELSHPEWLDRANLSKSTGRLATIDTLVTATVTTGAEGSSLDVASAIKATHAISSELEPERLFSLLIHTIIENAGAEHGYLVRKADGGEELEIAAQASVAESTAPEALPIPLDRFEPIARELVRYVARTHETIVLDDARADELYGRDPHVVAEGVQSVLCMPIVSRGTLEAVLYVENNAASRVFTPARVALLRVIAGQAAISIANAYLYEHLELKVAARTRELAERNRDISAMLNSLEQGVFTIDERLALEPRYSAHLERLLGQSELAGRDCIDLLFASAGLDLQTLDAMRAALEFSFGSAMVFAEANRPHWVREFSRSVAPGTPPRSFEVDWTPIADAKGDVCKILVAVRDVTLVKELRAAAAAHTRELDIVGQVLDASIEDFTRLRGSARVALGRARNLLEREAPTANTTRELFRLLHTLKGNARQLGLRFLAKAVHYAEEAFDARSAAAPPEARRGEMLAGVEAILRSLDEYEQVCREKLGDVFKDVADGPEDVTGAIARQVELVRNGASDPRAAIAAIELLLERAGAVTLAEVVKKAARVLPALAEAGNKPVPRIELDAPELALNASTAQTVGDALVHAFTNAVDHGLERATERAARGKPAEGCIQIHAVRTQVGTIVTVRDDGRGLAVEALRKREGTMAPDEALADRVFASGISTAATITTSSGRGVGLDAVRASLRELGGDAHIDFVGPNDNGHRPFELVLELPPTATPGSRSTPPRRSEPPPRPSRSTGTRDSWLPPGAS